MDRKDKTGLAAIDINTAKCEQIVAQANELAHRFFNLAGGTRHPDFMFYRGLLPMERMVWEQARLVFADVFHIELDACFKLNGACRNGESLLAERG